MVFAAPGYGWLALPVIMLFFLALRGEQNRLSDLHNLAEKQLLSRLLPAEAKGGKLRRLVLPLFGSLLLVIALMRPQWGVVEEEQTTVGLDIVIALDVSRSMLADDLAPNRLAVARKALEQLIDSCPEDRIALLAFAGTAFTVCPLTSDHAVVRQMLAELGPESLPKGGSSLSAALTEAGRTFKTASPGGRVLILASDGEDQTGELAPPLEKLRRGGIAIIAAVAGTREGGLIPLSGGAFVRDRSGALVQSRADSSTLEKLTSEIIALSGDRNGLKNLLEKIRAESSLTARKRQRQRLAERFQYPLAMALLFYSLYLLPLRRRTL